MLVWILGFSFGCKTASVPSHPNEESWLTEDLTVERFLVRELEKRAVLKEHPEVTPYLEKLALNLVRFSGESQQILPRVQIVGLHRGESFQNYSLPNYQIFLSLDFLKKLNFENELVAIIAVELAHISQKHINQKIRLKVNSMREKPSSERLEQALQQVDFLGSRGLFAYSFEETLSAFKSAVGILYRAGYDPRGVMSVLPFYSRAQWVADPSLDHALTEKSDRARSNTYSRKLLGKDEFRDAIRREIASFPPLRNPIVRSREFIELQKNLKRL